jgi:glycosyltransferase involved in cell wall biosynthesis
MSVKLNAYRPAIALVLPTLDERGNLEVLFTRSIQLRDRLLHEGVDIHLVVADGGSKDGTVEFTQQAITCLPFIHLVALGRPGYGLALKAGINYSLDILCASHVAVLDADLSHDLDIICHFWMNWERGIDMVIGSRFSGPASGMHGSLPRKGLSYVACKLMKIVSGAEYTEFTNSSRLMSKAFCNKLLDADLPWETKTYVINPAINLFAASIHANVKEVPIVFAERAYGKSKMKVARYVYDLVTYIVVNRLKQLERSAHRNAVIRTSG